MNNDDNIDPNLDNNQKEHYKFTFSWKRFVIINLYIFGLLLPLVFFKHWVFLVVWMGMLVFGASLMIIGSNNYRYCFEIGLILLLGWFLFGGWAAVLVGGDGFYLGLMLLIVLIPSLNILFMVMYFGPYPQLSKEKRIKRRLDLGKEVRFMGVFIFSFGMLIFAILVIMKPENSVSGLIFAFFGGIIYSIGKTILLLSKSNNELVES